VSQRANKIEDLKRRTVDTSLQLFNNNNQRKQRINALLKKKYVFDCDSTIIQLILCVVREKGIISFFIPDRDSDRVTVLARDPQ